MEDYDAVADMMDPAFLGAHEVGFMLLGPGAVAPRKAYGTDAGWDLFVSETTEVKPWTPEKPTADIKTDVALVIPKGYFARIVGRSSALRKRKMQVIEGIIDYGYQGELFTTVASASDRPLVIEQGMSLAQIIIQRVEPMRFQQVNHLPQSERGMNGFGSSGA